MTTIPKCQKGFSLLELMITLSVAAILLVIAVPSFRDVMHRSRVTSASNEVLGSLAYARTEAVNRGQLVSMCPSADGDSCAEDSTYESGWIVYTYPAGAASVGKDYVAAKDLLLRTTTARTGVSVRANASGVITFGQQGQLKAPAIPMTFATCYRSGDGTGVGESTTETPGAELDVSGSGSVRTKSLASGASCTPS